MSTVNPKQIFAHALQAIRRSRTLAYWRRVLSPSALVVEARCAHRIDALATRLAGMRGKISKLSSHLLSGKMGGMVDADGSLRRMLSELKDDLNCIRRDLAIWHAKECRGRTGKRLAAAIAQLNHIAAETYAAADRLEWEIVEHDSAVAR
jgi:hypothetical protein